MNWISTKIKPEDDATVYVRHEKFSNRTAVRCYYDAQEDLYIAMDTYNSFPVACTHYVILPPLEIGDKSEGI